MSPSADSLRLPSTATRRVISPLGGSAPPMAHQRSEFEDFMNAYRPNLEVPKKEGDDHSRLGGTEENKADFSKSLKKFMKRTQTSPNVTNKNHKKEGGLQRVPMERERSLCNELRPPSTSQVKKASKPSSAHAETNLQQPSTFPLRHPLPVLDTKSSALPKLETHPKNSVKAKTERNICHEDQKPTEPCVTPVTVRPPSPSSSSVNKVSLQELQKEARSSSQPPTPTEWCTSLCLFVARNSLDRFLPPPRNPNILPNLKVIEAPEKKYRVVIEFEESLDFQKPKTSPSGLCVIAPEDDYYRSNWEQLQAFSWTRESKIAVGGMLLVNVERLSEFSFVTYLVISGSRNEFYQKVSHFRSRPLSNERNQLHFAAGYEESITVCRPPIPSLPEKPSSSKCGFVISLYQVLPGEDGQRFEQNWVIWTGARQIYNHAPEYMGLRRISVHKSVLPTQIITYAVLCEFAYLMDYLTEACVLVDQLRARCCGFTGIYRVLDML